MAAPPTAAAITTDATRPPASPPLDLQRFVVEAAERFALPRTWIEAVARQESGFRPLAVSPKGALGLMQIMPATWTALRQDLGLGADPFDPHDNLLAGAGYLRRLHDQFGNPGFLAAYNAGPERYLDFLLKGRPLPLETRRYVAAVGAALVSTPALPPVRPAPRPDLFAPISGERSPADLAVNPPPSPLPAPAVTARSNLFAGAWGMPR